MNIFIGGSKEIGTLSPAVKKMLYAIIRNGHHILLGDCYGIDLAVQRFLKEQNYRCVTVYTACNNVRNNVGNWDEVIIKSSKMGYLAHKEKDIKMALDCDFGIMIWDGKSKGTAANIDYLTTLGKKVIIIRDKSS